MSRLFVFVFEAVPTSGAQQAGDVSRGWWQVWAVADEPAAAETLARAYVMKYGWVTESLQYAAEPRPEQLARLDSETSRAAALARTHGVAGLIDAGPNAERPGGALELRSPGPTPTSGRTQ